MPSSSSVREQLTDILARVVACPADAVVPAATLKELGADSLTILEIAEELGRRFGVTLSDDSINQMVTVQDAIDAVVEQSGSTATARTSSGSTATPAGVRTPTPRRVSPAEAERRRGKITGFLLSFAFLGVVIGGVLGLGGAALVSASGLGNVDLAPISGPSTTAPTPEETESPEPAQTTPTDSVDPTINTSSETVSPGERFLISGAFPGSPVGQDLQVEVKDVGAGQSWDDFPIQTKTRDGGIFRTELYTSRTGEREFRITNKATGVSTPSVTVTIG